MRYLALACDYDETIATGGRVSGETVEALERLKASGRKVILVTGRELEDLFRIFPHLELFERVVAENGAVLHDPQTRPQTRPHTRKEKVMGERPPEAFVEALRKAGVEPLSVGRVIVATCEPHQNTVLEAIRELGLELQVIFNKGAVMVLPAGINKASGLKEALRELGLSPRNVVGVGDGENDHAFLAICEFAAAVSNALPTLKERADLVTESDDGRGVRELIQRVLKSDLRELSDRLTRHQVLVGWGEGGEEVRIPPYGINVLVSGTSGSGKSTLATGLLERLAEKGYQFCVVDPEGDYQNLEGVVVLGSSHGAPMVEEILKILENPEQSLVANLLGIPLQDRPAFFTGLLPRLQEARARTGRPHWIVVDEAHHLLPPPRDAASLALTRELKGMIYITVHPDQVAPAVLSTIDVVAAVGDSPAETVEDFCRTLGKLPPSREPIRLETGEALFWDLRAGAPPVRIRTAPPRTERHRHERKYAEGELGPDKSFYFRGPEGKLNLRAQNLMLFLQMAAGVDDETWLHHLKQGDYSRWFREAIKDDELAAEAEQIEREEGLSASESRERIAEAIERHYTLPA